MTTLSSEEKEKGKGDEATMRTVEESIQALGSKTRCWDNLLDELEVDGWGRAYKIIRSKFKSPKSNDNELLCEAELRTVVSELFPLHTIISKQQTTVDEEIIPFTQDEVKTISAKMEGLLQIHVLYMKRWDEGM
ncbi:unnamed protein product [Bemisia tabaci]|uniref:Uncharacterized protein n=1 Tax=Bemisia tabaci TaxID=7038 RepID=A0A9P0F7C9_BEMTA|nr:unnamed protein product [Bemisia tabaci]